MTMLICIKTPACEYLDDVTKIWQGSFQCAFWTLHQLHHQTLFTKPQQAGRLGGAGVAGHGYLDCDVSSLESYSHPLRYCNRLLANSRLFALDGQVCAAGRLHPWGLRSECRRASSEAAVHTMLLRHDAPASSDRLTATLQGSFIWFGETLKKLKKLLQSVQ